MDTALTRNGACPGDEQTGAKRPAHADYLPRSTHYGGVEIILFMSSPKAEAISKIGNGWTILRLLILIVSRNCARVDKLPTNSGCILLF